jgi:hypothetical protein
MIKEMLRINLTVCFVVLVLAASAVPVLCQAQVEESQKPQDKSMIWGWWPQVPWDDRLVTASTWADVLNKPIDLARKGEPGDQHRYQIKRINLTVDRQGKIMNRMVAEGELSRTLLREKEPGIWIERCKWERFAAAQGMGVKDYPELQELPNAQGLTFEFFPRTFNYINPPIDFSQVGNEAMGYLLKVLTMDAAGWDSILMAFRDEFGGKVRIGDTLRQTDWKPWDITSVNDESSVGSYHMGEMQISIVGLTRFHGEPCVLIWFSMEGNSVIQNMETPQFTMDLNSTEYFRGELAASLVDGHLVAMELWGPLPCVMKMGFGDNPPTEQPIGAIIQQVSMWEIPSAQQKKKSNP